LPLTLAEALWAARGLLIPAPFFDTLRTQFCPLVAPRKLRDIAYRPAPAADVTVKRVGFELFHIPFGSEMTVAQLIGLSTVAVCCADKVTIAPGITAARGG
jgi:hypothetical protein